MRNGKYQNKKSGFNVRPLALLLAVVLLVGVSVGGTLAWLTDESETVTNTFTDSDINITLTETEREYKMIPGWTIDKDPVVTVKGGSEDCYLFVKIDESANFDDYMTYEINETTSKDTFNGWAYYLSEDADNVTYLYRIVNKSDKDQEFAILKENQVQVKDTVTKQMMDRIDGVAVEGVTEEAKPTLTFQAAAIQLNKSNNETFSVQDAFAKVEWPA